ncbi:heme oxygenase-like domain-containing protein [Roseivivax sp. CAU 1753]
MKRAPEPSAARALLADCTRDLHAALHAHAMIARLAAPDLRIAEYAALLQACLWFHQAVEDRRRAACAFEALTLDRSLAALRADLRHLALAPVADGPRPTLALDSPSAILAALYVLHGAPFGSGQLDDCIAMSLPDAPRHFVGLGQCRPLWRLLTAELDRHGQSDRGRAVLVDVTGDTVRALGAFVTTCGAALYDAPPDRTTAIPKPAASARSGAAQHVFGPMPHPPA